MGRFEVTGVEVRRWSSYDALPLEVESRVETNLERCGPSLRGGYPASAMTVHICGRVAVANSKRHENGTLCQSSCQCRCKLLNDWLLGLDSNQQPSG